MIYYAHFDKQKKTGQLLPEHMAAVANTTDFTIPPTIQFPQMPNHSFKEICRLVNYFHDFGKYTTYFQDYLLYDIQSPLQKHAHVSACFLHSLLSKKLADSCSERDRYAWSFLGYLCVRLHHSELILSNLFDKDKEHIMWEQLQAQVSHLIDNLEEFDHIKNEDSLENFHTYGQLKILRENKKNFIRVPENLCGNRWKEEYWYFALIYIFSQLIDSDKMDSAGLAKQIVQFASPERVVEYLAKKHGPKVSTLVDRREKARNTIMSVVESLSDKEVVENRLYLLTAPTGIGKTLASLQCALRLQERIMQIEGYTPRIITAIPFVNIIEQTKIDYQEVLGEKNSLVIHHRLADFTSKNDRNNQDEQALDNLLMQVEAWEGDVVLTTFVQFFHSILTGKNRLLKKLNKLAGSIIILDEIQSIPEKYMPLIGALLYKLSEYYGTRFILMTATQPKLLEWGNRLLGRKEVENDIMHLLPNYEEFFSKMKRTQFVTCIAESMNNEQFIEFFLGKYQKNKSALIVVNTIKRSIDIFKKLLSLQKDEKISNKIVIRYLSTNLVPKHRKEVIAKVREELKANLPVILISTQTIEAGVDLDFDIGFRDIAPLESLVQTAGRVNREGLKGDFSPVYIVQIDNDGGNVYGLHHIHNTRALLQKQGVIPETMYRIIIEDYYQEMMDMGIPDESKTIWQEGVVELNFEKLNEFKLIESIGEVADVFVELDEDQEATNLANAYEELLCGRDTLKLELFSGIVEPAILRTLDTRISSYSRKTLLRLVLAKMSNYMVQIRVKRLINNRPIDFSARNGIRLNAFWVPPGQVSQYYDRDTGFIDEVGKALMY
jgi:CRISPR-associated endonuclease/helicase Cas3